MKNNSAFTLLEMLIALAISSLVIIGGYSLLNCIATTKTELSRNEQNIAIVTKLSDLMNQDYRQATLKSVKITNDDLGNEEITFSTYNSIFFNKSIPVIVKYYISNHYLIREEIRKDINYDRLIRLIPDVKKISFKLWNGSEYLSAVPANRRLIKMYITLNNREKTIIIAKLY